MSRLPQEGLRVSLHLAPKRLSGARRWFIPCLGPLIRWHRGNKPETYSQRGGSPYNLATAESRREAVELSCQYLLNTVLC